MKNLYPILTLIIFTTQLYSCKKKEERELIRNYEGLYAVTHTRTWCCDSLNRIASETKKIELELRKSLKGVRIKGVVVFENFDVHSEDKTFTAATKNGMERAFGNFLPNDSISLTVHLSYKLPYAHYYRMKKK